MTDLLEQTINVAALVRGKISVGDEIGTDDAEALIRVIERQHEQLVNAGWQPIETAPKVGCFLVYMPEEHRQLQVMYRSENGISVIGGCFAFDLSKPTLWMPIQEPTLIDDQRSEK